jgi:hypothetical protein
MLLHICPLDSYQLVGSFGTLNVTRQKFKFVYDVVQGWGLVAESNGYGGIKVGICDPQLATASTKPCIL